MKTNNYSAKCNLSKIGSIQEAAEISYSAYCETDKISVINITRTNLQSTYTEEFRCQISFEDCIEVLTFLKENCVYPVHVKNIVSDLGYNILSTV